MNSTILQDTARPVADVEPTVSREEQTRLDAIEDEAAARARRWVAQDEWAEWEVAYRDLKRVDSEAAKNAEKSDPDPMHVWYVGVPDMALAYVRAGDARRARITGYRIGQKASVEWGDTDEEFSLVEAVPCPALEGVLGRGTTDIDIHDMTDTEAELLREVGLLHGADDEPQFYSTPRTRKQHEEFDWGM